MSQIDKTLELLDLLKRDISCDKITIEWNGRMIHITAKWGIKELVRSYSEDEIKRGPESVVFSIIKYMKGNFHS